MICNDLCDLYWFIYWFIYWFTLLIYIIDLHYFMLIYFNSYDLYIDLYIDLHRFIYWFIYWFILNHQGFNFATVFPHNETSNIEMQWANLESWAPALERFASHVHQTKALPSTSLRRGFSKAPSFSSSPEARSEKGTENGISHVQSPWMPHVKAWGFAQKKTESKCQMCCI